MDNKEPKMISTHVGRLLTFTLPSGQTCSIREQNGEDDDILSSQEDGKQAVDNFNRFVHAIVMEINGEPGVSLQQIIELKNRDKYYILLKSRIHSLGPELKFKFTCQNPKCDCEATYDEDLSLLDWDMSNKNQKPENLSPHAIEKYPSGTQKEFELTLSSGKQIKYTCLDGIGEKRLLDYIENQGGKTSINLEIIARCLKVLNPADGKYQLVGRFDIFSSLDMKEIRKHITEHDKQFTMASDIKCPKCGNEVSLPLIANSDFFFPSLI